jgi:hypothetical protein
MTILRAVILALSLCSPLSAQFVGAGFQLVRSDQRDMRGSRGPALRFGFGPIDLRYDYLVADGQRFDYPCGGGFIPPGCVQETIYYSSHVHSIFMAARARLLSRGSFDLVLLPEIGLTSGTFAKQSTTGPRGGSTTGNNLGAGAALELAASRLRGTQVGGWIAARFRGFVAPGSYAVDGYEPHRQQNWIGSVELGVRYALQPR